MFEDARLTSGKSFSSFNNFNSPQQPISIAMNPLSNTTNEQMLSNSQTNSAQHNQSFGQFSVQPVNQQLQPEQPTIIQHHPSQSFFQPALHQFPQQPPPSYAELCERVERLEQTVQSVYDVVDRIDKKFDLLISNQRQGSFDDLMSEEQPAESLTHEDLPSEFVDQPRKEDGTKRAGAKKDVVKALKALYKDNEELVKTKMAGLEQHLNASINFMKSLLADKAKYYISWKALEETNSQQKEIVMERFIQMVSTTPPRIPINKCDNNWIAHALISTKWDNIREPKNKNKKLISRNETSIMTGEEER